MAERSHLSIGEVLSLLRDEFPDVTISKIRFLESQGLVDPERTPSGYRKFYEHDVDRLRWILRQQREHFLPLKVIRGRLNEQGGEPVDGPLTPEEASAVPVETEPGDESTTEEARRVVESPAALEPAGSGARAATPSSRSGRGSPSGHETVGGRTGGPPRTPSLFAGLHAADRNDAAVDAAPDRPAPALEPSGRPTPQPTAARPAPAAPTASGPAPAGRAAVGSSASKAQDGSEDTETFTAEELAAAVGTEVDTVHELKQYGLIAPHAVAGGVPYYDHAALAVVLAAARFARHGVEARHLRVWRNSAEREADLYQQVVLPLLRQRNPQARRQALETLEELAATGAALRAALVERAVRDIH